MPFEKLTFCAYPNVGTNNGDLPESVLLVEQVNRQGTVASSLDVAAGIRPPGVKHRSCPDRALGDRTPEGACPVVSASAVQRCPGSPVP